ncbi:MAG: hypothetical protein GC162_13320 [Planctomycetes bacterium]|nr:hypothetical protein [Planctomycetota bacterium]
MNNRIDTLRTLRQRPIALGACALPAMFALGLAVTPPAIASTINYSGGTNGAWLTSTNWNSGSGPVPGSGDIAAFVTGNTATAVGINMNGSTNNGANNQIVGEILLASGTTHRNIGNSSSTADGTLTLNGVSGILLQNTTSTSNLTIQNNVGGGTKNTTLVFANTGQIDNLAGGLIQINVAIGGTNGFTKTGTGTLILGGTTASTYTLGTTVSGGTLQISDESQLGANVVGNNLTLGSSASIQVATGTAVTLDDSNRSIVLSTGGGSLSAVGTGVLTVAIPITGSTSMSKANDGTVIITGGSNSYGGSTNVSNGTLELSGGSNRLPTGTTVTVGNSGNNNGGILKIDGVSQTVANIARSGTGATNSVTSRFVGGSASNATLNVNLASGTSTYTGQFGGSSTNENNIGLTKSGNGTLQLVTGSAGGQNGATVSTFSANSYTGPTVINAGILSVSNLANVGSNSDIGRGDSTNATTNANSLVLNGGTLKYEQYSGTGAGAVSMNRLFSVGTSGGTIDSSGVGALGLNNTGAMGFNSQSGARTLTLDGSNTSGNLIAALIGDSGGATSLFKTGAGSWTLSNAGNTYTGKTTINNGTLQISDEHQLGNNPGSFAADQLTINNGATLQFDTSGGAVVIDDANRGITLSGTNANISVLSAANSATIANVITGSSNVAKTNDGTLLLSAANNYTGNTFINNGKVELTGSANRLPTTTSVQLGNSGNNNGGILQLDGVAQTVTNLTHSGDDSGNGVVSRAVGGSAALSTLTVDLASGTSTFNGKLGGTLTNENNLAFVKAGNGKYILTGANTYTGTTSVSAGTLIVNGTHTGGGLYTVASGATLGGNGNIGASVTVNGTFAPGNSIDTINITGNFTLNNIFEAEVSGSSIDLLNITGNLSFGGASVLDVVGTLTDASYTIITYTGTRTGAFFDFSDATAQNYSVDYSVAGQVRLVQNVVVVPTPMALPGAAGLGLLALAAARRR